MNDVTQYDIHTNDHHHHPYIDITTVRAAWYLACCSECEQALIDHVVWIQANSRCQLELEHTTRVYMKVDGDVTLTELKCVERPVCIYPLCMFDTNMVTWKGISCHNLQMVNCSRCSTGGCPPMEWQSAQHWLLSTVHKLWIHRHNTLHTPSCALPITLLYCWMLVRKR